MKRPLKNAGKRRESVNILAQHSQFIRWPLGHDKALAAQADEQRHGTHAYALGPLIRAHAGELLERSPKVRNLSHYARAEAIACSA